MKELRFVNWQDFQRFCCYWMSQLVRENNGHVVPYEVYGNDGQTQYGVDLVPTIPNVPVVGQSKRWEVKPYTWNDVQKDLQKTGLYPGPIRVYIILANARPHTSIQDAMPGGQLIYECPVRGKFRVLIKYWEDLNDLSFVPREELTRFFPETYRLATTPPTGAISFEDHQRSLAYAREFIPSLITPAHIDWLEQWDFNQIFVPARYFNVFYDLRIDIDRIEKARQFGGLRDWINEGRRLQLSQCLPAAASLFDAIDAFVAVVVNETIGATTQNGEEIHTLDAVNINAAPRITGEWRNAAKNVHRLYLDLVHGLRQDGH
jgi:hypothetical protein